MAAIGAPKADFTRTKSLRVGIVTTSFPVPSNPSSGIFVERLVAALPNTIRATVLTPCTDKPLSSSPNVPYNVDCFAYGPRAWMRLAHRPGGIPDALRRRDPAILLLPLLVSAMFFSSLRLAGRVDILHGNWSLPGVIAAIAARLRRRPAIATLRGEDMTTIERSVVFRLILAVCLTLNHRIVVVSESMGDQLCRMFPKYRGKIIFIPNGVEVTLPSKRNDLHMPVRLVTVGSLIHRKRIETLIHAVSHFATDTKCTLRIIGDGPEQNALEALASKLGCDCCIEFVGRVPPHAVREHLRWADVFVFSSESEGRPNVILEAMAEGLPIVASDIPGVRELIHTGAGLLYSVGDSQSLAACLDALSRDPTLAVTLGREAARRIETSGLTWRMTATRYEALYTEVSQEVSGHPCAD